jgi:hypothetical protein
MPTRLRSRLANSTRASCSVLRGGSSAGFEGANVHGSAICSKVYGKRRKRRQTT